MVEVLAPWGNMWDLGSLALCLGRVGVAQSLLNPPAQPVGCVSRPNNSSDTVLPMLTKLGNPHCPWRAVCGGLVKSPNVS